MRFQMRSSSTALSHPSTNSAESLVVDLTKRSFPWGGSTGKGAQSSYERLIPWHSCSHRRLRASAKVTAMPGIAGDMLPTVKSTIGDERIAIVEGIRSGSIDAIKRIGQRRRRSFGHRRPAAGARRRSRRKDFAGAGRGCQWVRRTSSASRFSGRRNRSASAAMIAMARSGKLGPILPSGYRRRAP